jgi:uncharacterized protein (DUF433 family)/DNA-binding transcriptional MerR regulator
VAVSYSEQLTAALGGVTVHQLRNWRSEPRPLLIPEADHGRSVRYSFLDLLAVRTVGHLRTDYSLQKIRKAVANLHSFADVDHLGRFNLVGDGDTIVWCTDEASIDLLKKPGQHLVVRMHSVLGEFDGWAGTKVVPLAHPKRGISIEGDVLDGFPVVERTRVPYETIAGLAKDGLGNDNIRYFYPAVSDVGIRGAVEFDHYVVDYNSRAA